jgi:hypothetical protein
MNSCLWGELRNVHLDEDIEDSIVWNLTTNGEYTSSSAYKPQFFVATSTIFNKVVWKPWGTPKFKFFAWWTI